MTGSSNPQRILVTGGAGFVGQHVVEQLVRMGHAVRVMVRRTSDQRRLAQFGVEIVYGDLADAAACRAAAQGIDVLVNLATTMSGSREEVNTATIAGSAQLFAGAKDARVSRLVHVSSMAVLPMGHLHRGKTLPEEALYETEDRYLVDYVRGKIASEKAALALMEEGAVEVAVLRPGIVYGPGGSWKLSRLGTAVGPCFFLLGGGRNELPVTFVKNLADSIVCAALARPAATGIFHIVDDEKFSARGFVAGFRDAVQPKLHVVALPRLVCRSLGWLLGGVARRLKRVNPLHSGHLDGCMLDYRYETKRARDVLKWRPKIGKAEALRQSYAAWRITEQPARRADISRLGRVEATGAPVRVGLVGCGGIAPQHLRFLRQTPHADVVACCDAAVDRAKKFATQHAIPQAYRDLDTMLQQTKPEAVHILTPPQYTRDIAVRCLRAGCHVLVEKPMALDAMEAATMYGEAAKAGRMLCVDHNHSFDGIMVEARRILNSGVMGEVIWMDSYYGFDLRSNPGNPYTSRTGAENWNFKLPGGLFQNLLPHPLSLVQEFLPDPVTVNATARHFRLMTHQATDELRVMLTTPTTGALVTVSLAASPKFQTLQIYCTHGALYLDFTYKLLRCDRNVRGMPRAFQKLVSNLSWGSQIIGRNLGMAWKVARHRWVHYDGMQRLIAEFHAAVRQEGVAPISESEAMRTLRIMDETWRQIGPQPMK